MADKLTLQQEQAVLHRKGKLLVSAAAGSGKTKVLVDRLLRYLTDEFAPADLNDFLIITYTKAAASELRGKIAAKLTERISENPENRHLQKQMQRLYLTKISTVHGFCGDILREYAYKLDLPGDFRVADENECAELRQRVVTDLLESAYQNIHQDPCFQNFVDTQGLGRDDRLVAEIILKVYDSSRCHLDPKGWLEKCLSVSDVHGIADVSDTVWGSYLIADFQSYLQDQIAAMKLCLTVSQKWAEMEKVSNLLSKTVKQLEDLSACKTWDAIVSFNKLDYGRMVFPKNCPDPLLADKIRAVRDNCKAGLEKQMKKFADPSAQILQDLNQTMEATRGLVTLVQQFDRDYTIAKRSRGILDFSDLEQRMLDLLLGKSRNGYTAAATEISSRFREVMVDEYQDSNQVQDAIFSALTKEKENCFMVGDVKQSIYQFRLADPGIFLEKYQAYGEDEEDAKGRKVVLSHNFRSGPEVIEGVNAVFSSCMSPELGGLYYGPQEALQEGVPHERLPDCGVELHGIPVQHDTYQEESDYVANLIQKMLRSGCLVRKNGGFAPVTPDDIVILLRSPGSVGSYYQKALEERGIRCTSGGGTNLLQTDEIATLRALLQTIYNPRLDIPLIAVLLSPLFGFTADELAKLRGKQKKGYVYDAILRDESEKSQYFLSVLSDLRKNAKMERLTQLLESCFRLTRIDSIYGAMPGGDARKENLQTFYSLVCDFESGSMGDLGRFLDHLTAMEVKGILSGGASASGCVNIMSIHKSKGLEFPVVFLCGLSRNFNKESLRAQILCDKELGLGLSIADRENRVRYPSIAKRAIMAKMEAESLSEEMRVLYVAMTRARDRLIMTYAAKKLDAQLNEISLRMSMGCGNLLCKEAVCPGEWVLYTAMKRLEAGEFFALGGKYHEAEVNEIPWRITVAPYITEEHTSEAMKTETRTVSEADLESIYSGLSFRYPWSAATVFPSKQTATGRKGRMKDMEAAEDTQESHFRSRDWRRPRFASGTVTGTEYGNAVHILMQHIRYERCTDLEQIRKEVERIRQAGFLTIDQADAVSCDMILQFFRSEIGQKLIRGCEHIREFKFSLLDAGERYGEGLSGEQVLLQGVVDCAILEPEGITVLDFKTDSVTEETLPEVIDRYRVQVQTYGEALARIFEKPVCKQYLYFFRINRFVEIP